MCRIDGVAGINLRRGSLRFEIWGFKRQVRSTVEINNVLSRAVAVTHLWHLISSTLITITDLVTWILLGG
jgi:hypothetical protein